MLIPCVWLAACQATPPEAPDWAGFLDQVDRMDAQQLQLARAAAMRQYSAQPTDANRLRAGYLLSRPEASQEQLAQSRELLAEIAADGELAPMRGLLDAEIRRAMELQAQLNALKAIEEEMVESQQQADEMDP